ncbi:CHAT domain-containing protein [Parafrankia sp. FMc6]|uniref:CHAT domain-containing tetratricopeptide repeat protein n=1 Tax=Parafrankia soli TaxID=2599596 RepID=UPI0034D6494E
MGEGGTPQTWASEGLELLRRGLATGDAEALDGAVWRLRHLTAVLPADATMRPAVLSNIGIALLARFERSGRPDLLDEAVAVAVESVQATPADHPDLGRYLSNLSNALQTRAGRTGSTADGDAAVAVCRRAVEVTPPKHPERGRRLSNLGNTLRDRFERTAHLDDLGEAVEVGREAVEVLPPDDPALPAALSNLGLALLRRFGRFGRFEDIDEAVEVSSQAVEVTPPGHPGRVARLSNLSLALRDRFGRTGHLDDLNGSVNTGREALDLLPADHPTRPTVLSGLGNALLTRYDRVGQLADLDEAVEVGRQAVDGSTPDAPELAGRLSNLGLALLSRFERLRASADLDDAIEVTRAALRTMPGDHPDRRTLLSNLGVALRARHERTGTGADLDDAIEATRSADAATPADHPGHAVVLSNLGNALQARFERTGTLADIDEAVAVAGRALAATPEDHRDRAGRLSNLANHRRARFHRTGNPDDLDGAVAAGRHAVEATPVDDPDRAARLSNLSGVLLTRAESTSTPAADLDGAVSAASQAVETTVEDHPERAGRQSNLGIALRRRFDHSGHPGDLDLAVEVCDQAVNATPPDEPERVRRLSVLSAALQAQFGVTEAETDLERAVEAGKEGAGLVTAPPRLRWTAARMWAEAAAAGARWADAAEGYAAAVSLLAEVAPRELTRRDQEDFLAEAGGLSAAAAVCALRAGDFARAVELFEQGRGVLLTQALDTRSELGALRKIRPDLADRFQSLAATLDSPTGPPARSHDMTLDRVLEVERARAADQATATRLAARVSFDLLVAEIRGVECFDRFLLPPRFDELAAAAADGPVTLVAASRFGSFALVLMPEGWVRPIPLPNLTPEALIDQANGFLDALDVLNRSREPEHAAQDQITATLTWLWKAVAGPVLDDPAVQAATNNGGADSRGAEPPRLWWCVSGPLAFLPLHAAGRHDTRAHPRPATVLDRVISSYTPTLRVLLHARRPRTRRSDAGPASVVVAMPETPDAPALPGSRAELAAVQRHLPGRVLPLLGPQARFDSVHAALHDAGWAHLACHAESDLANPSASRVLLYDHTTKPFTIVEIARLRLEHADLAYLSACSTARPGTRLADEAIHLASAFQLAGFRHVIATLWPVPDLVARRAVATTYGRLTADVAPTSEAAAHAVHLTALALRDRYPAYPDLWTPFIHLGA